MLCSLQKKDIFCCFKLIFFIFLVASFSQKAVSSDSVEKEIQLKQAIEEALKSNPKLESSIQNKLSAQERVKQGRAALLPSIDIAAKFGYDAIKTPVIHGKELYKQQVGITMTQLLFDASGTNYNIKLKRAKAKAAEYKNFETSELIGLEVANSFLNILRQRELIKIAKINMQKHNNILNKIRYGEEQGKFNKGDLAQAIARVTNARINIENIKKSLIDANTSYKRVVGSEPKRNMLMPEFSPNFLPRDVDKLIDQAKKISPILAGFRAKIEAAKSGYKSVKSIRLPTINLEVSGTKGENLGGIAGKQTLGSALLVVKWNLFSGGANSARIKEAYHQEELAQSNEMDSLRKLENDIKNTWASRKNTISNIKDLKKIVEANKKVTEVYTEQFELNRRSLLDLLNTQNEFFISQSNLVTAVYSKLFADFRLTALRGDLLKTLDIKIPETGEEKEQRLSKEVTRKPIKVGAALLKFMGIKTSIEDKNILHNKPSKKLNSKATSEIKSKNKKLYYIQLASFKTALKAQKTLDVIIKNNSDIFLGLKKKIKKSEAGLNGHYYRLQVGLPTKKAAKNLCKEIENRKLGGCFIVR